MLITYVHLQIQQITKILNSHMDSLQWIDQNTCKFLLYFFLFLDYMYLVIAILLK